MTRAEVGEDCRRRWRWAARVAAAMAVLAGSPVVAAQTPAEDTDYLEIHRDQRKRLIHEGIDDEGNRSSVSLSGPSLVRVPDELLDDCACNGLDGWSGDRCYYLYYGHHSGGHIRMSFSDSVMGDYRPFPSPDEKGVLSQRQDGMGHCYDHISSPNVHLRPDLPPSQRFVMYYHCENHRRIWERDQRTWVATSPDGLQFVPNCGANGCGEHGIGHAYASATYIEPGPGVPDGWMHMSRTSSNRSPFTFDNVDTVDDADDGLGTDSWTEWGCDEGKPRCSGNGDNQFASPSTDMSKVHHVGITSRHNFLYLFFHRKELEADTPMGIHVTRLPTWRLRSDPDWHEWGWEEPQLVLSPVEPWERGGDEESGLCDKPGQGGPLHGKPKCDVRDPFVFEDQDGESYLVYAAGGETAIGIVPITWHDVPTLPVGCSCSSTNAMATSGRRALGALPWLAIAVGMVLVRRRRRR